jgi:hypothetical protein
LKKKVIQEEIDTKRKIEKRRGQREKEARKSDY